jgi:BirA family biotin operon repressor/biotin-[acetyl-CoA-carboxylase] ligase
MSARDAWSAFDAGDVARALRETRFHLAWRALTDSTNDDAAALLGDSAAAGRILAADYQAQGRGRHARAWVAPAGSSLLCTTILPDAIAASSLWAVPFWCAVAVADAVEETTGARLGLQWPNDLLLDGRKCCGILSVSRVQGGKAFVACGVGLNVTRPVAAGAQAELRAIDPQPAFISDCAPAARREQLLIALARRYDAQLPLLEDPAAVARRWEARAQLYGTTYRILRDGETLAFEASARRIADDGSLIVLRAGREERIGLADARVLR